MASSYWPERLRRRSGAALTDQLPARPSVGPSVSVVCPVAGYEPTTPRKRAVAPGGVRPAGAAAPGRQDVVVRDRSHASSPRLSTRGSASQDSAGRGDARRLTRPGRRPTTTTPGVCPAARRGVHHGCQ
ncbi:hypothetical protein QJS66_03295 [Kocuria rhizophila]|nr:hypothetical protein QJS66_03295 [Kocuria rhizophila]